MGNEGVTMYSPFRNEQGQPKSLDEVAYADLAQLKDEEGFALEFKRTWNENVRAKIPKIIASFANSHGGWLVIGIADDNKTVCPVPKQSADFSQIFGELCRLPCDGFVEYRFGDLFAARFDIADEVDDVDDAGCLRAGLAGCGCGDASAAKCEQE